MDLKFIKIPKTGSTFFEKNFHGRFTRKNDEDVKVYSVGHSWVYPTKIKGWLDWDYPNQKQQIFRDVMVFNLNPSDRIVTLVRNPFEILFSYFNYDWADCRKSHGLLVGGLYTKEDFQKFVDIYLLIYIYNYKILELGKYYICCSMPFITPCIFDCPFL